MKSLGETLKESRELRGLTLRQVEEATGISNAYLSQLENGKILKPSANVLYKLSEAYNIDLPGLLRVAGIIEGQTTVNSQFLSQVATYSEALTPDEEQELLNYLRFLRSKNKQ